MGSNQSSIANGPSIGQSIAQTHYNLKDGADVWFIIDEVEPIPGHQWILKAVVPLFKKDLTNGCNEIHLSGVSVDAFMEFLKFIYLTEPNLTMEIVEGVMHMANRWKSWPIFEECKQFLKKSITKKSTLFLGYQLAAKYQLNDLKALYLDEICVNTYAAFQTDGIWNQSFLTLPYEYIVQILECDSLACKEIVTFNASIAWAKQECTRNGLDPSNVDNLRTQLGDLLYQIRFNLMTIKVAAKCIDLHPKLFTEDELEEILCMIGHVKEFKPKQFNWTVRYYNLNGKEDLMCSRLCRTTSNYNIENQQQITQFTCNRRIELHGIECEWFNRTINCRIPIQIIEFDRNSQLSIRYDGLFEVNSSDGEGQNPSTGFFSLDNSIILRPNYTYEIHITFPNLLENSQSSRWLKEKVRIDYDTVFRFTKRGAVTSLKFRRYKNRNFLRKIIHDPTFWVWILITIIILCSIAAFYIWPYSFYVAINIFSILLFLAVLYACCICLCKEN